MRNIVEVSAFTASVNIPENGDPVAAETRDPSFQALANRTKYLNEVARGEASLASPASRALYIPGMRWDRYAGSVLQWMRFGNGLISIVNNALASLSLDSTILPSGAIITALDALVNPGAARSGSARLSFTVAREGYDFATPGYTPTSLLGASATYPTDTTDALQVVPILNTGSGTILPITHDPAQPLLVQVTAGNDAETGSNPDILHVLRVTFTDPGPRNF